MNYCYYYGNPRTKLGSAAALDDAAAAAAVAESGRMVDLGVFSGEKR